MHPAPTLSIYAWGLVDPPRRDKVLTNGKETPLDAPRIAAADHQQQHIWPASCVAMQISAATIDAASRPNSQRSGAEEAEQWLRHVE